MDARPAASLGRVAVPPLVPGKGLFFVQTALLAPEVGASSGWSVVVPSSTRAVQAIQPDETSWPDVFEILSKAARDPAYGELLAAAHDREHRQIGSLVSQGLLVSPGVRHGPTQGLPGQGLLSRYQEYVSCYPFVDCSTDEWLDDDIDSTKRYLAESPSPLARTPRAGTPMPLDYADLDASPDVAGMSVGQRLATVLRTTFGALGEIGGWPVGPWLRKSAPSGGARHPTEGWVDVVSEGADVPLGRYVYDVQDDCLRRQDSVELPGVGEPARGVVARVYLRSRVERPMWRYREPRSWRPVLIDCGHIVEMLRMTAAAMGLGSRLQPVGSTGRDDVDWLIEPWLFAVDLLTADADTMAERRPESDNGPSDRRTRTARPRPSPHPDDAAVLTNPYLYGWFTPHGPVASATTEAGPAIVLDEADLAVLTHCLDRPGRDRDTTAHGMDPVAGPDGAARRRRLIAAGLLWSADDVRRHRRELSRWCHHHWYLSVLAHSAVRTATQEAIDRGTMRPWPQLERSRAESEVLAFPRLAKAARSRRTVRAFDGSHVLTDGQLESLVRQSVAAVAEADWLRVFVAPLRIEDGDGRPFEWRRGRRIPLDVAIDGVDVRRATIGQASAGRGAFTMWLVSSVADMPAPDYELRIAALGCVAQRLAILAADDGLGLFPTPALGDDVVATMLGLDPHETAAYCLTVGRARADRSS